MDIMQYTVIFAPEARDDYRSLSAFDRAKVRDAIDKHLVQVPTRTSKSRIKRLRDLECPQYRLRVDDIRVFYDVKGRHVEVLGIVKKSQAAKWLKERGES
jgi:mRNA-degrading endonuclease RelE of RelBE toxin-antitoxin system